MALKDNCLHATTKKPYIKSLTGGINKSQEGHSVSLPSILTQAARESRMEDIR